MNFSRIVHWVGRKRQRSDQQHVQWNSLEKLWACDTGSVWHCLRLDTKQGARFTTIQTNINAKISFTIIESIEPRIWILVTRFSSIKKENMMSTYRTFNIATGRGKCLQHCCWKAADAWMHLRCNRKHLNWRANSLLAYEWMTIRPIMNKCIV